MSLALVAGLLPSQAQDDPDAIPLIFNNNTGTTGSQLWIQFRGGELDGYFYRDYFDTGSGQMMQQKVDLDRTQSYSLDQIKDSTLYIREFESGRIYTNYGLYGLEGMEDLSYQPANQTPTDPNYNTRYQYFEATIQATTAKTGGPQIFADLTYIDFTAISFSMEAAKKNPSTGTYSLNTQIINGNQNSLNTQRLIDAALTAASPNGAQVAIPGGTSTTLPNNDFARVDSPAYSSAYPSMEPYYNKVYDWTVSDGNTTKIAGEFFGVGTETGTFVKRQDYFFNLTFSSTEGSITTPTGEGDADYLVLNGTAGDSTYQVYISKSDLIANTGIYGDNPGYKVYSGTSLIEDRSTEGIANDVFGRVVGDLLAGMNLGYIASDETLASLGITGIKVLDQNNNEVDLSTIKIGELESTLWWGKGQTQGETTANQFKVPTAQGAGGEYNDYYTAYWEDTVAGNGQFFDAVQPNLSASGEPFYSSYSYQLNGVLVQDPNDPSKMVPLTDAYTFPLGDRLGENLLSYIRADGQKGADTDILFTFNPDQDTAPATAIWNSDASGNWDDTHWVNAQGEALQGAPASGASIQFSQYNTSPATLDTGSTDRTLGGIYFNYGAGQYVVSGDGGLTLNGNILNFAVGQKQTVENDITLTFDSLIGAAYGDIELSGNIDLGTHTLTVDGNDSATILSPTGTGTTTVQDITTTLSGDISGTGGLVKEGAGTLKLLGNNTFTGNFEATEGTVALATNTAAGAGDLFLSSRAPAASSQPVLNLNVASEAASGNLTLDNSLVFLLGDVSFGTENPTPNSDSFELTGDVWLAGDQDMGGPLSDRTVTTDVDVTFSGILLGSADNYPNLIKDGTKTLTLSGSDANAYAGNIKVNEGGLDLAKDTGVAVLGVNYSEVASGTYEPDTTIFVGDGEGLAGSAVVTVKNANVTPEELIVNVNSDGEFALEQNTTIGQLEMSGGSVTGPGTLTLHESSAQDANGDPLSPAIPVGSSIQFINAQPNASATISAGVSFDSANSTITVASTGVAKELTITGDLHTTSSTKLSKNGAGLLALGGTNNNTTTNGEVDIAAGILQANSMSNVDVKVSGGALGVYNSGSGPASTASTFGSIDVSSGGFYTNLGTSGADEIETASLTVSDGTTFYFAGGADATQSSYKLLTQTSGTLSSSDLSMLQFVSTDISGLTGTFALMNGDTELWLTNVATGTSTSWTSTANGSWATGTNWNTSAVPVMGSNISFDAAGTIAVDTGTEDRLVGSITFTDGTYTLSGSQNTLAISGDITNNTANKQTINQTIALTSDRTINAAMGDLEVENVMLSYQGVNVATLTVDGDHDTTINGITDNIPSGQGDTSMVGNVVKNGMGTLFLTQPAVPSGSSDSAYSVLYTGTTTINGGIVNIVSSQSIGNDTLPSNQLIMNGGTLQVIDHSVNMGIARQVTLESSGGTFDVQNGSGTGELTINGKITGSGTFTKTGDGTLAIGVGNSESPNDYTGETLINGGVISVKSTNALGSYSGANSGTTVASGAMLELDAPTPLNNEASPVFHEDLTISGDGVGGNGALYLKVASSDGNSSPFWNGDITLAAAATINNGSEQENTFTLKSVDTTSNGYGLTVNVETQDSSVVITGANDASGNLANALKGSGSLTKTGAGTLSIGVDNPNYSGSSVTISEGVLSVAHSGALGTGTPDLSVSQDGATFQIGGTSDVDLSVGALSLNGQGQTITMGSTTKFGALNAASTKSASMSITSGSLLGDADINVTGGNFTLSGGDFDVSGHNLTLYSTGQRFEVSAGFTGSGTITLGSGETVFSGNNSGYTGSVAFSSTGEPTLIIAASDALPGGGVSVAGGGTLGFGEVGGTDDLTIASGSISISGGTTQQGALTNFSGDNTFSGTVTLSGGTSSKPVNTTITALDGSLTLQKVNGDANNTLSITGSKQVLINDLSGYTPSDISVNNGGIFAATDKVVGMPGTDSLHGKTLTLGETTSTGGNMGTFSPGGINMAEQVTLGGLSLSADGSTAYSQFLMDLGATQAASDKISVTTGIALPSALSFSLNPLTSLTDGQTYTMIELTAGAFPSADVSGYTTTFLSGIYHGAFNPVNSGDTTLDLVVHTGHAQYSSAGNGNWSDSGNWGALSAVPTGGSAVEFSSTGGTSSTPVTVDTGSDLLVSYLQFAAGSTELDIQNNTLELTHAITNESSVQQRISSDILVSQDASINATNGNLLLAGSIQVGNSSEQTTLTFDGAMDTTITASGSLTSPQNGGITTPGDIVKTGDGSLTFEENSTISFEGTATVSGGSMIVNTTTESGLMFDIQNGATLGGSGTIGGEVTVAGVLSPGNSPGMLTTGSQIWMDGGSYQWELYNTTGVAGVDYDLLHITDTLDLGLLTTNGFTIEAVSFSSPTSEGPAINFDPTQMYAWNIVTTDGGIIGEIGDKFFIDLASFENASDASAFYLSISEDGNDLVLNYAGVIPEPTTGSLMAAGALVALWRRRLAAAKCMA